MDVSAFRRTGRVPAILLTLGLQAFLLLLLLYSFQRFTAPQKPVRETMLRLPRLVEPRRTPRMIVPRGNPKTALAPPLFVPPESAAPPAMGPQPDIRSLGPALNNCAPEVYANLPKEQRARCDRPGEGLAMLEAPNLMGTRSHVKDEAHWQEEWAREQSNVLLPCLGGVDVLCLLKVIATGDFSQIADPRRWPRYQVEQIPPEDFKKIEDAYDAWHKAHREGHLAAAH